MQTAPSQPFTPDPQVQDILKLETFQVGPRELRDVGEGERKLKLTSVTSPFPSPFQDHFDLQDFIATLSDKLITTSIQDPSRESIKPSSGTSEEKTRNEARAHSSPFPSSPLQHSTLSPSFEPSQTRSTRYWIYGRMFRRTPIYWKLKSRRLRRTTARGWESWTKGSRSASSLSFLCSLSSSSHCSRIAC